jgi:putative aminopeptidase FrvX
MVLLDIARQLDIVPNVPFFRGAIEEKIINEIIEPLRYVAGSKYQQTEFRDSYNILIRFKHNKARHQFVIVSHIDHPGFVFNRLGKGFALGSVGGIGNRGVEDIRGNVLPLNLFTVNGIYLGQAVPTLSGTTLHLPLSTLPTASEIIGQWAIDTSQQGEFLLMRSADNHAATIVAYEAILKALSSHEEVDVTLVFTTVEEVYQLSATHLFGNPKLRESLSLSRDAIYIVLEAMEMTRWDQSPEAAGPEYDSGPLIKINDGGIVYGDQVVLNEAEMLLLQASSRVTGNVQYHLSAGSTDATAISIFSGCPHLATLALPCRNKHNVDEGGNIVAERIRIEDIHIATDLLYDCLTSEVEMVAVESLRNSLYREVETEVIALRARNIRSVLLKQNRPRIENQFYLANTLGRQLQLLWARI